MTSHSEYAANGLVAFRSRADDLLVGVLGLHFLVCLVTGVLNGTWGMALSIGLPAFLVPLALTRMARGEPVTRVAVGCAFMIDAALLIQQTQGTIEAHFGIFVLLAFLVLYCDWLPLLAAAALIAIHHVGFAWLQYTGAGVYVFPEVSGISRVVVHAVYVVVETVLLCYMAAKLRGMVEDGMTVAEFASQVSQGRLDYRFAPNQQQLRPLLGTVSQMQDDLRATLRDVHDAAGDLNALAARLTASSVDMSHQSARQGESINTMAAATQEMTVSISHVAQSAAEARRLADDSRNAANDGSQVVTTTAREMVEIANVIEQVSHLVESLGKKSEEASQVVNIIKGIADQTNLLALNAAIEAARAGEVGRGFAVVADEVRKLAEHTMTATNQIAQMMGEMRGAKESVLASIMDAVKRVQAGVLLADEAGKRIEAITHQSTQVENIVATISSALDQQNAATQDIAQHVENISRMAETSTAAIDSVASEAHNLEGEANQLIGALGRFKL